MTIGDPTTATAARLYLSDLERAYRRSREVWDPDYALGSDPDVYDVIARDPETAHAIQMRRHLVAGSRVRVVPADDSEPNRTLAAVVERLLARVRGFGAGRYQLANAVFRGSAWAIVEGRRAAHRPLPDAPPGQWWVPSRLRDVDKRRLRQVVSDDGSVGWQLYSIARGHYEPLADRRRWFVRVAYDEGEATLGYGRGLVEALYHWQYAKSQVLQEALAGVERWSQGLVKAKIGSLRPGSSASSNSAAASAWLDTLEKWRARHFLVHGEDDEVELIESSGSGDQMAGAMLDRLGLGIRVLILGSNLPTSASSGGSYALAEVQESSTEALVSFDRELLGEALSDDLVPLVLRENAAQLAALGLADADPPRVEITGPIRRDATVAASALGVVLNAGLRGIREDEAFSMLGLTPAGPYDAEVRLAQPSGAAPQAPTATGPGEAAPPA